MTIPDEIECAHGGNIYKCQTCIWEKVQRIVDEKESPIELREYILKARKQAKKEMLGKVEDLIHDSNVILEQDLEDLKQELEDK